MTAETAIRQFMAEHYLHFNSREVVSAAKAWEAHLAAGGKMLVTLAGGLFILPGVLVPLLLD